MGMDKHTTGQLKEIMGIAEKIVGYIRRFETKMKEWAERMEARISGMEKDIDKLKKKG